MMGRGGGPAISAEEKAEILHCAMDLQMSTVQIAHQIGRSRNAVGAIVRAYAPTSKAAFAHFRAKALQMAEHVVKDGSVAEHIDVLRDEKVGVLTPKGTGSGGGAQVAVFVGMGPGQAAMLIPSPAQLAAADPKEPEAGG